MLLFLLICVCAYICATDSDKFIVWLAYHSHFSETMKAQEQKNLGSGEYKLVTAEIYGRIMNLVRQLNSQGKPLVRIPSLLKIYSPY